MKDARTNPLSPVNEARMIGRIAKLLDSMPRSSQLRILGYLTARVFGVGTCEASETFYRAARAAQEEEAVQ